MQKTILLAVLISLAQPLAAQDEEVLKQGRELTKLFYGKEFLSIWQRMSTDMQGTFGNYQRLGAFQAQAESQLGAESRILSEQVSFNAGIASYVRTAEFERVSQPILVQWALDSEGTVVGFVITPARTEAPTDFLDYETKTRLRLPFQDEWYVVWGGRSVEENYHASTRDQRFAYDLVIRKDGSTHTGDGKRNQDYYCFGKPLLAPAAGTVHAAVDGVEDNVPGEMNPRQAVGNHVILDHGNGEFSFLAHFQNGSLRVSKGDSVEAGQNLGLCGNSGNSSEPHLHYHLQNTPVFREGDGLPAPFHGYIADGERVERGEPVKGQSIRPDGSD